MMTMKKKMMEAKRTTKRRGRGLSGLLDKVKDLMALTGLVYLVLLEAVFLRAAFLAIYTNISYFCSVSQIKRLP